MSIAYAEYAELLSPKEKAEIDRMLAIQDNKWPLELEEIWALMDLVWEEMGLDNLKLDQEKLVKYYGHPVWLLNGLFAESHALSMEHRNLIADWIGGKKVDRLLDYGGGFCTLGRLIAEKSPPSSVNILEPYPSNTSLKIIERHPEINFVDEISGHYDVIVALDVLEHLEDPLLTLSEMAGGLHKDGYLLLGNNFWPVIKCHLPRNFYLRTCFQDIAARMNLKFEGVLSGSHVEVYRKYTEKINMASIRRKALVCRCRFLLSEKWQDWRRIMRI